MIVAFQGELGAYSEQAAHAFFQKNIKTLPCKEFRAVFRSVTTGQAAYGILPIENSLTGSIHQNYDLLLNSKVWICGEYKLRVSHNLLGLRGATLGGIREVYSHPQALEQCAGFLRQRLRRARQMPYFDTAGSAKHILASSDPGKAAIAGQQAAKDYGLKVIRTRIEDNEQNFTRFLLIRGSRKMSPRRTKLGLSYKTSVVFALKNIPGALYKSLSIFAIRDIDLLKIESRPIPGSPWKYIFYLDFVGYFTDRATEKAISHLEEISQFVKLLGSYPMAR